MVDIYNGCKSMKKLIMFLGLVFLIGCQKEKDRFCWECFVKDHKTDVVLFSATYCDKTVEELDSIPEIRTDAGHTYRICYNKEWQ